MKESTRRQRARIKKKMQAEGLLQPDKKRLDRKKFIKEIEEEWSHREDKFQCTMMLYRAAQWMFTHGKGISGVSLEAVGAAKIFKIAMTIYNKRAEIKTLGDEYEAIKDIMAM